MARLAAAEAKDSLAAVFGTAAGLPALPQPTSVRMVAAEAAIKAGVRFMIFLPARPGSRAPVRRRGETGQRCTLRANLTQPRDLPVSAAA